MDELLNLILGTSFRELRRTYPVKLALPTSQTKSLMSYEQEAEYLYRVDLSSKDRQFPRLITILEPEEFDS